MNQEELNNALIDAVYGGDLLRVKEAVAQGANIRAFDDRALRGAAVNGHHEMVKFLKWIIKIQEGRGSKMDKALYKIMMKECR